MPPKAWEETGKKLHDATTAKVEAEEKEQFMAEEELERKTEAVVVEPPHPAEVVETAVLAPRVEHSTELATQEMARFMPVEGLEEIPLSMLPIPFYKLVQPGSTNVTLSNGHDAEPGTIYMMDIKEQTSELTFALLRAKRQNRVIDGKTSVTIGVLAYNLERMTPFIISLSSSIFKPFGALMANIKERGARTAWEYPIKVTMTKFEEMKQTEKGMQKVKWYKMNFDLLNERLNAGDYDMLTQAYLENATKLDRQEETTQTDDIPF